MSRHIFNCATEAISFSCCSQRILWQAEISKIQMSFGVEQNAKKGNTIPRKDLLLWFQIPKDDIKGVKMSKCQNKFGHIKFNILFSKHNFFWKPGE